jgi:hypothetical protein
MRQANEGRAKNSHFLFRLSTIYLATFSVAQDARRQIGGRPINNFFNPIFLCKL